VIDAPPLGELSAKPTEGAFRRRGFTLTRRSCDGMGRVRSARASPGVALMFCTVSAKFERFAWSRYPEAFGSRILNPLRWRPPTGRVLAHPGPPGRFRPGPAGLIRLSRAPKLRRDRGEPAPNQPGRLRGDTADKSKTPLTPANSGMIGSRMKTDPHRPRTDEGSDSGSFKRQLGANSGPWCASRKLTFNRR